MKITILQENLRQAIQDIQKSVPARPALPILACTLIKTEDDNTVSFLATDLNIGIRSTVPATVIEAGSVAVPAKVFSDYINTLSAGEIELSFKDDTLTLKSGGSKATIQCLNAADYPTFPEKEGTEYVFTAEDFHAAVQHTTFSSSADDARPILTAVLFLFGESLEVVATDGFRLSTTTLQHAALATSQLLLPARALNEVMRISTRKQSETVAFTVSEKLKQVFFSFDGIEILVRLMEGEFPPYQKIIPAEFATQVVFDGNEFNQKLKTAMIFARDASGIIRFQITPDSLKIISSSSAVGTQESSMPLKLLAGGEGDVEIAFNAKYLADFLSVFKPEEIWFGMNESLKPALFRPAGLESFRYIVMPFRVNQGQ